MTEDLQQQKLQLKKKLDLVAKLEARGLDSLSEGHLAKVKAKPELLEELAAIEAKMSGLPSVDEDTAEKRIDPADGSECTYTELCDKYKSKYKKKEIAHYWEYECTTWGYTYTGVAEDVAVEPITLTVVRASGEVLWGPAAISNSEALLGLHAQVFAKLGGDDLKLTLVNKDQPLRLSGSIARAGVKDGDTLTAVISNFDTERIKNIQDAMGSGILPGLTDEEVAKIETKFAFRFPPDLKAFLQVGVPSWWHNWRDLLADEITVGGDGDTVSQVIEWHATPEREEFVPLSAWLSDDDTFEKLKQRARAHPLIPIWKHRMMPSVPHQSGLPVISMHQCSDNIIYANTFWDWLEGSDNGVAEGLVPEDWKASAIPFTDLPFWKHWID